MRDIIRQIAAVVTLVLGTAAMTILPQPECGTTAVRPEAGPEPTTSVRRQCAPAPAQFVTSWKWRAYDVSSGRWHELAQRMTAEQARHWSESTGRPLERVEGSAAALTDRG